MRWSNRIEDVARESLVSKFSERHGERSGSATAKGIWRVKGGYIVGQEMAVRVPGGIRAVFWTSAAIGLAAVARRLLTLARPAPAGPPNAPDLDAIFASHAVLTMAHIVPAAAFLLLVPFVCLRQKPGPWLERLLILCGVVTGFTAYALARTAIGGGLEQSAVVIFDSLFLFSLFRFQSLRKQEWARGQQWLIRAVGILLGIATTRPVMVVFFATRPLTGLGPEQFFGMAFWIGFSLNTIAVEAWVRSRGFLSHRLPA